MTMDLNRADAARVHYVDPRVRQLAEARWRLATGGTEMEWLALHKDNPEALIEEARDWMRAAVAAGILDVYERDSDDAPSAPVLSKPERQFLSWALDQAANELQLGGGGNDEDWSAIVALRKLAVEVTS